MVSITVNTGILNSQANRSRGTLGNGNEGANRGKTGRLKVLLLASLSGTADADPVPSEAGVRQRKVYRIDKDNFEEVFRRFNVSLSVPALGEQIEFNEYDSLDPDYIYEHLDVFAKYRQLIRNLKSKDRFAAAVEQLKKENILPSDGLSSVSEATAPGPSQNGTQAGKGANAFLNDILASAVPQSDGFSVDRLIKETVAPYIEEKPDPRLDEYISAVQSAASDLLRGVLHASQFERIESNWRSLDLLNRSLDTDQSAELHVMNLDAQELMEQQRYYSEDIEGSDLYQRVLAEQGVKGVAPFDFVVLGDVVGETLDLEALKFLQDITGRLGIMSIAGVDLPAILQSPTWGDLIETPEFTERLSMISFDSQNHILAAPRFLTRLPYGRKTKPIESMDFEELESGKGYLWSSASYLVLLAIAQEFSRVGSFEKIEDLKVAGLPFHVTVDEDGDEMVVPMSESYLPERAVNLLSQAGLTCLQSVKNSDQVIISNWSSIKA